MINETGDMKILGNFRRLIDLVIADVLYNPSNAVLSIASLEAKLAAAIAAVNDIGGEDRAEQVCDRCAAGGLRGSDRAGQRLAQYLKGERRIG